MERVIGYRDLGMDHPGVSYVVVVGEMAVGWVGDAIGRVQPF